MWNCTWNDSLSKQQPVCSASPLHNIFKMQLRWVKGFKNLWSVARLQLRTKTPGFIGEASFEVVKFVCKNEHMFVIKVAIGKKGIVCVVIGIGLDLSQ